MIFLLKILGKPRDNGGKKMKGASKKELIVIWIFNEQGQRQTTKAKITGWRTHIKRLK